MNIRISQTVVFIVLMTATTIVHGQEIVKPSVWTLQQCIDWAKVQNIDIRQNRLSVKEQELALDDARKSRLPEVGFSSSQSVGFRPFRESSAIASGSDPVGQVIRFNKIPVKIVGVLKSKGYNSMGMDQDDVVLMPYTTVMKRILAQNYLSSIYASAITESMTDKAIDDIISILRTSHRLKADADDDFSIRSQEEMSSMMNSTTDMMTTLLACIAGISLVVGGIGIMNIMYVSVTERTKEIGLRMSVGARGIDILSQFLIESILISVTGGIIGVILGIVASYFVKSILHWPISIEAWTVVLSFVVCSITGVFFGWYPAKKAANLDPIEAIRYE